jgi:hypothetical protein
MFSQHAMLAIFDAWKYFIKKYTHIFVVKNKLICPYLTGLEQHETMRWTFCQAIGRDSDPTYYLEIPVWHVLILSSALVPACLLASLHTRSAVRLWDEVEIVRLLCSTAWILTARREGWQISTLTYIKTSQNLPSNGVTALTHTHAAVATYRWKINQFYQLSTLR